MTSWSTIVRDKSTLRRKNLWPESFEISVEIKLKLTSTRVWSLWILGVVQPVRSHPLCSSVINVSSGCFHPYQACNLNQNIQKYIVFIVKYTLIYLRQCPIGLLPTHTYSYIFIISTIWETLIFTNSRNLTRRLKWIGVLRLLWMFASLL